MTFWRSTTGRTSCPLWLAPSMAPRCPSSCSAAATSCIFSSPPTTADPTSASKYYMRVSLRQREDDKSFPHLPWSFTFSRFIVDFWKHSHEIYPSVFFSFPPQALPWTATHASTLESPSTGFATGRISQSDPLCHSVVTPATDLVTRSRWCARRTTGGATPYPHVMVNTPCASCLVHTYMGS